MRAPVWLALKGAKEDFVNNSFIFVKQDLKIHKNKLKEYPVFCCCPCPNAVFCIFDQTPLKRHLNVGQE